MAALKSSKAAKTAPAKASPNESPATEPEAITSVRLGDTGVREMVPSLPIRNERPAIEGKVRELVIRTPTNPAYAGTTYGVQFHDGMANVTPLSKKNRFGHTVEQLAWLFIYDAPGIYEVEVHLEGEEEPLRYEAKPKGYQLEVAA